MTAASAPATKQDLNDLFDRITATFATKDDLKAFATKDDLKAHPTTQEMERSIERIVGDTVGEIVGDVLDMMAARFDKVDARFDSLEGDIKAIQGDVKDLQTITMRVDNKLNDIVEVVNHHGAQLRLHQRKLA